MSLQQQLIRQLNLARGFTEQLFRQFQSPQEWTTQVFPGANHPLWVAGHLGFADNFALRHVAPERVEENENYHELFGMGSQPKSDPEAYPPVEEVLQFTRQRRQVLLEVLQNMQEEQLARKLPEGSLEMLSTVADLFGFIALHEGLHAGQMSMAHRSLGRPPLVG